MNWRNVLASRSRSGLSRAAVGAIVGTALMLAPASAYAQNTPQRFQTFNVVPITVSNVIVRDGRLFATGVAGSTTFESLLTMSVSPEVGIAAACPILNLELAPINLSVLGLNVDTSAICLDVTANSGQGLLGDLLCSVANLLSGGTPLADILASLTEAELTRLTAGLTSLLNQAVFIPISASPALIGASCNILNLALGPVDLNLLGLRVELDNCANGPVTLDLTATPGGGLLGDLLCGLSNVLNNPIQRLAILRQLSDLIGSLLSL